MTSTELQRLNFSNAGYSRVRNLAREHSRSMSAMLRLMVASMLREDQPTFSEATYDANDLTRDVVLALDPKALSRLVSRAHNRDIPAECIGEWLSNYQVAA